MSAEPAWGVDSEYGSLLDVLLCAPENYKWGATSAISRATLASGRAFEPEAAVAQHAEMVSAYEQAGVRCHFLEPDEHLPYQVFTRDSSTMGPGGTVVTAPNQSWRRGEYAAVIRFHQEAGIPIRGMISAGSLEGGDVVLVEPGAVMIGNGESRTEEAAARQLAGWFEEDGWEARVQPIPERYVHLDVLVSILAPKLAAVCVDELPSGGLAWLRSKGFEVIEISALQAFSLGVNAISLGDDRILSAAGADLNDELRARGFEVLDPELDMFTLGGGGPHCLAQALRRERMG